MAYELKDRQTDADMILYKDPTIPEEVKEYACLLYTSVILCIGSIIFNISFRSIIILIKYRCLSLHRMYVGIPIAQIWQNLE